MDDPHWLTPEELEAWRYLSAVLLLLPGRLDEALAGDGMTFFDYSILVALSSRPDRCRRMSELAFATQGSLSRLSHAAKRLEGRGWLRRSPCPDDGRVTLVTLTDEGMAALEAAAPRHVASVRRLVFDVLHPSQVADLAAVGAAVFSAIQPGQPPPWARSADA